MSPNLKLQPRKWLGSVNKFLQAWSAVRICPDQIKAPTGYQSFSVLTLAVSLAIVVLARVSVAGSNTAIDALLIATIISVSIVFLTGYINLILRPGPNSGEEARRWGIFFVMTWLTSLLLLILVDALPFWLGYSRSTTTVVDTLFGPDTFSSTTRDFVRAILFGISALAILLYKTKRMDQTFRATERCTLITIAVGLAVNTILMGGFIYGHVV